MAFILLKYTKLAQNLFLLSLLFAIELSGCSKGDYSSDGGYRAIVSNTNENTFKEVNFLINFRLTNPIDTNYKYLLVSKIENLVIQINDKPWGTFQTNVLDTAGVKSKLRFGDNFWSRRKINYMVIATHQITSNGLYTAGEFSNYLNAYYDLLPGDYIAQITEFTYTNALNQKVVVKPNYYINFTVKTNERSLFLGELSLDLTDNK